MIVFFAHLQRAFQQNVITLKQVAGITNHIIQTITPEAETCNGLADIIVQISFRARLLI